jgi:Concanavalin A-like lectin/glucanases superfamily
MAYTTNGAHHPTARSLVGVLVLAMALALAPGGSLADVRAGLIADYRSDESAGSVASDSGGHSLHGRLEGAPQWEKGHYGNGLRFDGAQDYVYIGRHDALDVRRYTLAAWVRTDGRTSDPQRQEILEKMGAYWLNIRKASRTLRAGGFFGGCRGHAYWTYLDTATAVPMRTWALVAATYNGKALTNDANGDRSLGKAEDRRPCTANHRLLIIGAEKPEDHSPAEAFSSGILDEVRIYARALSQEEIQEVMRASRE